MEDEFKKLTVKDLQKLLRKYKLPVSGKKSELIDRLEGQGIPPAKKSEKNNSKKSKKIENMTVAELKFALKANNLKVSGKKEVLIKRLKNPSTKDFKKSGKKSPTKSGKKSPTKSPTKSGKKSPTKSGKKQADDKQMVINKQYLKDSKYKINKKLSSGQQGQIYLATDTISNDTVIIKASVTSNEKNMNRFVQELGIATIAGDAGISPVIYDSIISDDRQRGYIIMQYIEGPTFLDILLHSKQNEPAIERASLVVIEKINRLHQLGISHLDLNKLNNVIYDVHSKEPYIIDFGLSEYKTSAWHKNFDTAHFSVYFIDKHELTDKLKKKQAKIPKKYFGKIDI